MAKALDGVTVPEFASHIASGYAAMLMAEQGARTIKVEPPGGEPGRGGPISTSSIAASGRSSLTSIALREWHRRASCCAWPVSWSASWFPDRQRALGLDYESVRRLNRRVLMLTMPPMGGRPCNEDRHARGETEVDDGLWNIDIHQAGASDDRRQIRGGARL